MEPLGAFITEAFSDARLAILQNVQAGPCRYVDLARTLRISEGELSRHLKRLSAAGLLSRDSNGRYSITGIAAMTLAEEPRLRFLARYRDFFATHSLDGLPPQLMQRLPDLAGAYFIGDPFSLIEAIQTVFGSVRKRFLGQWIIGTEALTSEQTQVQKILIESIQKNDTPVRMVAIEEEFPRYSDIVGPVAGNIDARILHAAPTSMAISDTHALVSFNGLDGRIDGVHGFWGDDPAFIRWCEDSFEWFWSQGKPARLVLGVSPVRTNESR